MHEWKQTFYFFFQHYIKKVLKPINWFTSVHFDSSRLCFDGCRNKRICRHIRSLYLMYDDCTMHFILKKQLHWWHFFRVLVKLEIFFSEACKRSCQIRCEKSIKEKKSWKTSTRESSRNPKEIDRRCNERRKKPEILFLASNYIGHLPMCTQFME